MHMLLHKIVNLDYKHHLVLALTIRLILLAYGIHHDEVSRVKYTDVDYKVFTDAARHVLKGNSPYDRHTYRYSPLIAIILIPNIILHHSFGKVLFCVVDIVVAVLIHAIVKYNCLEHRVYTELAEGRPGTSRKRLKYRNKNKRNLVDDFLPNLAMICWLYNPLTIAIATRGNCDSLATCFVLLTLHFLQNKRWYFTAGLTHGLAIHFRLYPIIYSITYFMYLSKFSYYSTEDRRKENGAFETIEGAKSNSLVRSSNAEVKERKTIFKKEYLFYLLPNLDQLNLMSGCLTSLLVLTLIFNHFYGYKFLYEAYIYHFIRKDTRHNFSLYFYLHYITAGVKNIGLWQKALVVLPQLVLILIFGVRYGLNRFALNFGVLTQTIVMVVYNGVLTSQYFVWIFAILPLCLWQIKISGKKAAVFLVVWFVAQGVWLLPAYFLEFQGQNTFLYIWVQCVSFFCANIAILGRLITYFMPMKDKVA